MSPGSGVVTSSEEIPCAVLFVRPGGTVFTDISWYWLKYVNFNECCQENDATTNEQAECFQLFSCHYSETK